MADAASIIASIKATKPMDLIEHPFSFAVGIGLANGLLAKVRGKGIDVATGIALAAILGIGEAVIVALEKPDPTKKHYSPALVALYSVIGVGVGLAPFVTLEGEGGGLPIAEREREKGAIAA